MDTFTKFYLGNLAILTLLGAFYALGNRKYIVKPGSDDKLRKIRICGWIMFLGGMITILLILLK